MTTVLPFGTWPSPVTPGLLSTSPPSLVDVWVSRSTTGAVWTVWLESRPSEGGRLQLVVLDDAGRRRDLLPEGFSARSAAHEYGGGAALVDGDVAWFVNWADQRVYRIDLDGASLPVAWTPEPSTPRSVRFADLALSADGRWLAAVREVHHGPRATDVANEIVIFDATEPSEARLVEHDADFVMSPAWSGSRLRFVAWDHPNMPWDSTRVVEANVDSESGSPGEARVIADGASYLQPAGDLVISDRGGWWNLWRLDDRGEAVVDPRQAEIAPPPWVFGTRSYCLLDDGRVVSSAGSELFVDAAAWPTAAVSIDQLCALDGQVTAIAAFADRNQAIVRFAADRPTEWSNVFVLDTPIGADEVSVARHVAFPTVGGSTAYGWFYPPRHVHCVGPAGDAAPLVVMVHGGPTAAARPMFSLAKQFWTSRGFAVLDVDYRGSTGYGTEYRTLLDGQWGVVDVEDCASGARWCAEQGLVDGSRMVIRGGSAGGLTVLSCLISTDIFAAGCDLYGVADLVTLAEDTHKFESRYLDRMIGPWPQSRSTWEQRSPLTHIDGLHTPVIVFQGLDDRVVPPSQSEAVVAAMRRNGVDHEYHAYPGEGHGFRREDTIIDQLSRELAFYQRVLGLGVHQA